MRWQRETAQQKCTRLRTIWHRRFAWWPYEDHDTQTVYWLEFVWVRKWARDKDDMKPWRYDVRGGRYAPEIKQPAPGQTSTVV